MVIVTSLLTRQRLYIDTFVFLAKVCNTIPSFPRKYKKEVHFLLTAGDKWNKVIYLRKIEGERFCLIQNVKFHFIDKQVLI